MLSLDSYNCWSRIRIVRRVFIFNKKDCDRGISEFLFLICPNVMHSAWMDGYLYCISLSVWDYLKLHSIVLIENVELNLVDSNLNWECFH